MSETLLGVLIGLFGSILIQVLLQAVLLWREQQERARSVRLAPLDRLPPVIDSVAEVISHQMLFEALASNGIAYPTEKLFDAALSAVVRIQRARVSLMAAGAPSEVFTALDEVSGLLSSVAGATEGQKAALMESTRTVLSQIEKQYMALKRASDKFVIR